MWLMWLQVKEWQQPGKKQILSLSERCWSEKEHYLEPGNMGIFFHGLSPLLPSFYFMASLAANI